MRENGIVEFFDEHKGFGMIKSDDRDTYFAHASQIQDIDEQVLIKGEEVTFTKHQPEKGLAAHAIVRKVI